MESPNAIVGRCFDEHLELLALIREQHYLIEDIAASWCSAIKAGCKLMLCGNGGSAADSQHIAAELVGRLKKKPGGTSSNCLNDRHLRHNRYRKRLRV